jgi:2-phosphoglycerate kinase
MTQDEKRQQKMELLLQYQEAEDDLAHLRERAKQISERLGKITAWLHDYYEFHNRPMQEINQRNYQIVNDPQYRNATNFNEMIELVEQIRVAQGKLAELAKRKESLGLR